MLINVTQSRLVIGRFNILPGEKLPAFELTGAEAEAVEKFKSKGKLVERDFGGQKQEADSAFQAGNEKQPARRQNRRQDNKPENKPDNKPDNKPENNNPENGQQNDSAPEQPENQTASEGE